MHDARTVEFPMIFPWNDNSYKANVFDETVHTIVYISLPNALSRQWPNYCIKTTTALEKVNHGRPFENYIFYIFQSNPMFRLLLSLFWLVGPRVGIIVMFSIICNSHSEDIKYIHLDNFKLLELVENCWQCSSSSNVIYSWPKLNNFVKSTLECSKSVRDFMDWFTHLQTIQFI